MMGWRVSMLTLLILVGFFAWLEWGWLSLAGWLLGIGLGFWVGRLAERDANKREGQ